MNTGPVIHGVVDITTSDTPGWMAFKTIWYAVPSYQGPFLVRGEPLGGSGRIALLDGATVAPLVVPPGPTINTYSGYRTVVDGTYVTAPGCYGLQVDGTTFSEVVVLQAVLP